MSGLRELWSESAVRGRLNQVVWVFEVCSFWCVAVLILFSCLSFNWSMKVDVKVRLAGVVVLLGDGWLGE